MKRATSKDVAKLAGVSQTTVSFVMNNTPNVSLSEETRKKVLDAANQLQYIPNSFARGLKPANPSCWVYFFQRWTILITPC